MATQGIAGAKRNHLAISESKISGPVERFLNQNSNTIFGVDVMKLWLAAIAMTAASSLAHATDNAMTVYQDPNCGCCGAWVEYMQDAGLDRKSTRLNSSHVAISY